MELVALPAAIVPVIKAKAAEHRIEPAFLGAVVWRETRGHAFDTRYEPDSGKYVTEAPRFAKLTDVSEETERVCQMMSWGLVQVMGFKARELGFRGLLPELCQADVGLELGCCLLKHLATLYGAHDFVDGPQTFDEAVASAYNHGSPWRAPDGSWVNLDYVAGVRAAFSTFKEGF